MSNPPSGLIASGVTLIRDARRILDDVSLAVQPGRVLAVIGPNGAGKSSLLSVMSGLWKIDRGQIQLDGRDIGRYAPAERARHCAVMRQDSMRPAGLSVQEAVELGRLSRESGDDASSVAREWLQKMDLAGLAGRDCTRLSGGEWQRVAFARTVAQIASPDRHGVLLLDEPVSGLDPAHQHQLLGEVRRLAGEGHAVLVILHDLNLTAQYADEVALLASGCLRACGPAREIMQPGVLSGIYGCRVVAVGSADGPRALVSLPE